LIAGNAPEARLEKLHAFWEQVTTQLLFDPFGIAHYWLRGDLGHVVLNRLRAGATLLEGAPGFFKPRIPPPYLAPPGTIEATRTPRRCGARWSGSSTSTASMPARCASALAPSTSAAATSCISIRPPTRSSPSTSWRAARCRPAVLRSRWTENSIGM